MSDLIERLRDEAKIWPRSDISGLLTEAADRIATLERELAEARKDAAIAQAWDECRNSRTNWHLHTAEDFIEAVCARAREIDAAIAAAGEGAE